MRILHINTISRSEAKKIAPWAVSLQKKVGGFIAYESRQDIPKRTYRPKVERKYGYKLDQETKERIEAKKLKSKYDKRRYKQKMELIGNKYFPFKTKQAYLRFTKLSK